jgi:hypothetical protein
MLHAGVLLLNGANISGVSISKADYGMIVEIEEEYL